MNDKNEFGFHHSIVHKFIRSNRLWKHINNN